MKHLIVTPTPQHFCTPKNPAFLMFNTLLTLKDKYPDITLVHCELAWIEDARNHFLQDKYVKDCEWMLWWDNDVIVTQAQTMKLIQTFESGDYDMLSGIYFMGQHPHFPVIYKNGDKFEYYNDYPKQKIFEISGCGFGFVIISGKLLRSLPKNAFNRFYKESAGQISKLGEDLSFCRIAREYGFKIYADSSILLGHQRVQEINEETFKKTWDIK